MSRIRSRVNGRKCELIRSLRRSYLWTLDPHECTRAKEHNVRCGTTSILYLFPFLPHLCLLLLGTRDPSLDLSPATLIARVYFTNKYSWQVTLICNFFFHDLPSLFLVCTKEKENRIPSRGNVGWIIASGEKFSATRDWFEVKWCNSYKNIRVYKILIWKSMKNQWRRRRRRRRKKTQNVNWKEVFGS